MRVFSIQSDESWPYHYTFDVERKWGLPGIACEVCGQKWAAIGREYPWVQLPEELPENPYKQRWPVDLVTLQRLRQPLLEATGGNLDWPPGTGFGPLVGSASGKLGEVTWPFSWSPLITHALELSLRRKGVQITVSAVEIISKKTREKLPYSEINFLPAAQSAATFCIACNNCKLLKSKPYVFEPDPLVLLRNSIPEDVDFFSAVGVQGLFMTEFARNSLMELHATNCTFEEVQVA